MRKLHKRLAKAFEVMLCLYDDEVLEYIDTGKSSAWRELKYHQIEDIQFSKTNSSKIYTLEVTEDSYIVRGGNFSYDECRVFSNILDVAEYIKELA